MKGNFDTDIENMIQKKSVRKGDPWLLDELSAFGDDMYSAIDALNDAYSHIKAVLQGMPYGDAYAIARGELEQSKSEITDLQGKVQSIIDKVADGMDEFL